MKLDCGESGAHECFGNIYLFLIYLSFMYLYHIYMNSSYISYVSSLSLSFSLSLSLPSIHPSIHPYLHLSELFLTTWHGYTLVHGLCVLNKV